MSTSAIAATRRGIAAPREPDAETARVVTENEIESLARELAHSYQELVSSYRRTMGLDPAAAAEQARTPHERALAEAASTPPDQMHWWTLAGVMEHDPAAALAAWQRVCDTARAELYSGHRTAQSLEWGNTPWDRARFLAVRQAFRNDWRPRGGVEAALVDLLAQTFSLYLIWSERVTLYAQLQGQQEDRNAAAEGVWLPPRLSEARWMAWCAEQADHAHRRFLQTLRTLHDLRRQPAVTITAPRQVNFAQHAVNVAPTDGGAAA